jgi:hypothetical protein
VGAGLYGYCAGVHTDRAQIGPALIDPHCGRRYAGDARAHTTHTQTHTHTHTHTRQAPE